MLQIIEELQQDFPEDGYLIEKDLSLLTSKPPKPPKPQVIIPPTIQPVEIPVRALLVDLVTGENTVIDLKGNDHVRSFFPGSDVRGKTLRQLSESVFLREWIACDRETRRVAIIDAYDGTTLKRVDLPRDSMDQYLQTKGVHALNLSH
jgi:hypothetical protein